MNKQFYVLEPVMPWVCTKSILYIPVQTIWLLPMVLISDNYGNLSHLLWQVEMFFFIGQVVYFPYLSAVIFIQTPL